MKRDAIDVMERMVMVGKMSPRLAAEARIDRDVAFSMVAETMSESERRFGQTAAGKLLERYALEAAIDLLSRPAKVHEFLPDLAVRQVQESLAAR